MICTLSVAFFGTQFSFININDCHNLTEILITLTLYNTIRYVLQQYLARKLFQLKQTGKKLVHT